MEARENLDSALVTVVDDMIAAGSGVTSGIKVSQFYPGLSYDRVRRQIIYSVCYVADADGPTWTNNTGFGLYSGIHTINAGADYNEYRYKNFSIMVHDLDSETVTRHDCWSSTSAVPNGIGPSDGTYRRFVEADFDTSQVFKLVDPRTGNVWSHHTSDPTSSPTRSCLIYEFRLSEDYAQTISPYVPDGNRHLEMFGINDDWVLVGDFDKTTNNVYDMQLLPRVRTADEVTADFLLSYADFDAPAATAEMTITSAMDAEGNLWWFTQTFLDANARVYKLYKLEMPTSAPFGGPVVGGGWSDETPWSTAQGPDAASADYRGEGPGLSSTNEVIYHPGDNTLICLAKIYPTNAYPTPSSDVADFAIGATFVDLGDLSFEQHDAFVSGYMDASWAPAELAGAAYAVLDCWVLDQDLRYHNYEFETVDYDRRWFAFAVMKVEAGVVQGSYLRASPLDSTGAHIVMVEYDFSNSVIGPQVARVLDENGWDATYSAYGTAISDANVVMGSLVGYTLTVPMYDAGFWDEAAQAWWWSGQRAPNFSRFDADYTERAIPTPYVSEPPFLRLSLERNRGACRIRYGDLWG